MMKVRMLFAIVGWSLLAGLSETAFACSAPVNEIHQKNFLVASAATYFNASLSEVKNVRIFGFDMMLEKIQSQECPDTLSSWARISSTGKMRKRVALELSQWMPASTLAKALKRGTKSIMLLLRSTAAA